MNSVVCLNGNMPVQDTFAPLAAELHGAMGTHSHPGFQATADELVSVFPCASLDVYDGAYHFQTHTTYVARRAAALRSLWARVTT